MSLAENISERLSYKFYSSGAITSNTEPVASTAPGASGGQVLRHVSHTLSLTKDTYQSNEKRTDRQISDFRHGVKRINGAINGLLSPSTYADFFQAATRGTWAAGVSLSNTELTSAAADNATSKFTFGSGDPVALGMKVGDIMRFTNMSDVDNNARNFLILGFGGASNRDVTVYPAPDTMAADTSFNVVTVGKRLIVPASNHVSRLVALESYQTDLDIAQLYTECRVGGFNLNLPPTGNAEVGFNIIGRNRQVLSGASAPFFTAPTAETSTGICAAVNGLLRVNGVNLGVVTGLQIGMELSPNGPPVSGQNIVPEIFLGSAVVSGQFSAFFEDSSLLAAFDNESEIQLLAYLTADSALNAAAMAILLPRIKLGSANESDDGSGGKTVQYNFQALKYGGSGAGIDQTTIRIVDTEVP